MKFPIPNAFVDLPLDQVKRCVVCDRVRISRRNALGFFSTAGTNQMACNCPSVAEAVDDEPVAVAVELVLSGAFQSCAQFDSPLDHRIHIVDVHEQEYRRAIEAVHRRSLRAHVRRSVFDNEHRVADLDLRVNDCAGPGIRVRSVARNAWA